MYLTVNSYLLCYTSNNLKFCMNLMHIAQSHDSHQKQWIAILIMEHNFYIYCCDILYCKSFIYVIQLWICTLVLTFVNIVSLINYKYIKSIIPIECRY